MCPISWKEQKIANTRISMHMCIKTSLISGIILILFVWQHCVKFSCHSRRALFGIRWNTLENPFLVLHHAPNSEWKIIKSIHCKLSNKWTVFFDTHSSSFDAQLSCYYFHFRFGVEVRQRRDLGSRHSRIVRIPGAVQRLPQTLEVQREHYSRC